MGVHGGAPAARAQVPIWRVPCSLGMLPTKRVTEAASETTVPGFGWRFESPGAPSLQAEQWHGCA